jgi:hypothetical protein
MIKIQNAQGLILELDPTNVITIEKNSPLFNDTNDLLQDVSYAGVAGLTDNNKAFFGLGHLVEASNTAYVFPIQMFAGGDLFLNGNIKYRIGTDGFEYNLELNLTTITALLANIRLTEIITEETYPSFTNQADFEAHLLDTAKNPDKFNYVFFPVYNPGYIALPVPPGTEFYIMTGFVNNFDLTEKGFTLDRSDLGVSISLYATSPFFKLSYVIKQVAKYLGFNPVGGFFSDPKFTNYCIYTRQGGESLDVWQVEQMAQYLPNILITDLFKFLRDRLHLIFDFNVTTQEMTVESFQGISDSLDVVDLTPYVTNTLEQELPDQTGYTVSLKTDQQDVSFQVEVGADMTYPPLYEIQVGDGSDAVELDCATTNQIIHDGSGITGAVSCAVNQSVICQDAALFSTPDPPFNNSQLPPDISYTDPNDASTKNNWPLRLMEYTGFNEITPGNSYPTSQPVQLGADDLKYYQFLNDSKRLIIYANIPPAVLSTLKTTGKYCFKTAGYNYTYFIMEQLSYDMGATDELVPCKIYVRTLTYNVVTPAVINTLPTTLQTVDGDDIVHSMAHVKAYFDPLIHGITQVNISAVTWDVGSHLFTVAPILIPANIKGAGGSISTVYALQNEGPGTTLIQFRISQGVPQYMVYRGQRLPFIRATGYYYVDVQVQLTDTAFIDNYTIFF